MAFEKKVRKYGIDFLIDIDISSVFQYVMEKEKWKKHARKRKGLIALYRVCGSHREIAKYLGKSEGSTYQMLRRYNITRKDKE